MWGLCDFLPAAPGRPGAQQAPGRCLRAERASAFGPTAIGAALGPFWSQEDSLGRPRPAPCLNLLICKWGWPQ